MRSVRARPSQGENLVVVSLVTQPTHKPLHRIPFTNLASTSAKDGQIPYSIAFDTRQQMLNVEAIPAFYQHQVQVLQLSSDVSSYQTAFR